MAHANINQRREAVSKMLANVNYTNEDVKAIAKKFRCTRHCIIIDMVFLKSKYKYTVFACTRLKREVLKRDNHQCQYCGKVSKNLFVDHVVPYTMRGPGYAYNLVACCGSCNVLKGKYGKVWTPNNGLVLQSLNPKWFKRICRLSRNRKRPIFKCKTIPLHPRPPQTA